MTFFPPSRAVLPLLLAAVLLALVGSVGCRTTTIDLTGPQGPPTEVDYAADVQPIFTSSCGGGQCHIQQATNGVRLHTREAVLSSTGLQYDEPIIDPGDASRSASPLVDKILPNPTHGQRMPLNRSPLGQEEISILRNWIEGLSSTE